MNVEQPNGEGGAFYWGHDGGFRLQFSSFLLPSCNLEQGRLFHNLPP